MEDWRSLKTSEKIYLISNGLMRGEEKDKKHCGV